MAHKYGFNKRPVLGVISRGGLIVYSSTKANQIKFHVFMATLRFVISQVGTEVRQSKRLGKSTAEVFKRLWSNRGMCS